MPGLFPSVSMEATLQKPGDTTGIEGMVDSHRGDDVARAYHALRRPWQKCQASRIQAVNPGDRARQYAPARCAQDAIVNAVNRTGYEVPLSSTTLYISGYVRVVAFPVVKSALRCLAYPLQS